MNDSQYVSYASSGGIVLQAGQLSRLTRELSRCCQTKEEQIFGRFGLSSAEGRVLLAVAESVTSTPSVVADKLGLGRSRLTPLVESLVQKRLLQRAESSSDRRVRSLSLTEGGLLAAKEVTDFQIKFHTNLLEQFSEGERAELLNVLDHLHEAIEDLREKMSAETLNPTT